MTAVAASNGIRTVLGQLRPDTPVPHPQSNLKQFDNQSIDNNRKCSDEPSGTKNHDNTDNTLSFSNIQEREKTSPDRAYKT